jgi:bacterioferritin (cytochrome b1)
MRINPLTQEDKDNIACEQLVKEMENHKGDVQAQHVGADQLVETILRLNGFPKLADKYFDYTNNFWYA